VRECASEGVNEGVDAFVQPVVANGESSAKNRAIL
jgi:hypothetical protein